MIRLPSMSLGLVCVCGLVAVPAHAQSLTWSQRSVPGPSARGDHAMTYDTARQMTVLFGGSTTGSDYLSETWEWNGSIWTQRSVSGPSSRYLSAMTFDISRNKAVLFGGYHDNPVGETWEWDGTAWNHRIVPGPSPRWGHAMVYDSVRTRVVLFGGYSGASDNGETWEWDGAAWQLRTSAGPAARRLHAMAYDSARGVAVLFGGTNWSFPNLNDIWEWNGTSWIERGGVGPSPRASHSMAFDISRAATIVFGGQTANGFDSGETWAWNGNVWNQLPITNPSARDAHAMAYDTSREVTVMFGGYSAAWSNQTWELGCAPFISSQPLSAIRCKSGSATFSVTASTAGATTYQWQWQTLEETDWHDAVNGVNYSTGMAALEANAVATSRISVRPPVSAGGIRLWPQPGFRFRVTVSDACGIVSSNVVSLMICPADFNCDNAVDFFDYLDFVDEFSGRQAGSDFNADGVLDFFDYLDFVDAFSTGC